MLGDDAPGIVRLLGRVFEIASSDAFRQCECIEEDQEGSMAETKPTGAKSVSPAPAHCAEINSIKGRADFTDVQCATSFSKFDS